MHPIKKYHYISPFSLMLIFLLFSQYSFAEEILTQADLQSQAKQAASARQSDYIYDLQIIDPALLTVDVINLRTKYIQQQHTLTQKMKQKELDAADIIISIIMPGGLFYAGYRSQEINQVKKELSFVSSEIEELSNDLADLQLQHSSVHSLLLAQLP